MVAWSMKGNIKYCRIDAEGWIDNSSMIKLMPIWGSEITFIDQPGQCKCLPNALLPQT
jgi:hypothetical protein